MKKFYTLLTALLCLAATANAQDKILGGDLSLVPAYEAAGDRWFDEEGNNITTYYTDGMITFFRDVAKWNTIRVRLLVNPTQDSEPATCQDIEYVKKLGKRIKDAGMNFLLDIFYSDTWTDVSQQWIPVSWGYNRTTAADVLATKVKSYTTEVLNELTSYGAKPDLIQLGNEVSYSMLWDSAAGGNKTTNWFVTSGTYAAQKTKIERFATLLKAAKEGVDASNAAGAKIILHCERTVSASGCLNFYNWVNQAGFTDYDIIGLSYYPFWHGDLSYLKSTLSTLQNAFPTKEIHIVETGYFNNNGVDHSKLDYDTSDTWSFSSTGQAAFLTDLVTTLASYKNVKGLYYWQPEECGNGADSNGNNRVMSGWDNRGFWELSWKSGNHAMKGGKSVAAMQNFLSEVGPTPTETDITSQFENMGFENGEEHVGWTINTNGWYNNAQPCPQPINEWHSSLTSGFYLIQGWTSSASNLSAGHIFYQSKDNMPAGTYTVTAIVHTDYNGICLFANNDTKVVTASSTWDTAYEVSVSTTLTEPGTLTFGLTLPTTPTSTGEVNLYADNFTVKQAITTGIKGLTIPNSQLAFPVGAELRFSILNSEWFTLDGRKLSGKPAQKGIYINNGKKIVVR